MKKVISVRFKENGKSYYFDPAGADIKTGEYVIVETARGIECGEVVQGVREITDAAVPKALKPITRMADSVDIRRMRQNREDEKRAYHTCQECIARHGLEMKLVEAEYTLDRSKIMFYFTAMAAWTSVSWSRTWPASSTPASSCARSACGTRAR